LLLVAENRNIRSLDYTWTLTIDGSAFTTTQNLTASSVTIAGSALTAGEMTIVLSVKYSGMSGFTTTELETDTMTKTVTILDDKALDVRFAAGDN